MVVALFIAALVFFVGFRVTKVQIEGNQYYTDEEIKKMVLDAPNAGNSILVMLTKTEEKTKDAQMIDHVTIKRGNSKYHCGKCKRKTNGRLSGISGTVCEL